MPEQEYWFARRFPVGHPRNAMSPINEQGWNVVRKFIIWMVAGAVLATIIVIVSLLWLPYLWIAAPFVFAATAMYAGWALIEDYKAGRVR
jgi:flagellar biosynthesis protein FliP